jgi:UDP-glucose 4-epimerase
MLVRALVTGDAGFLGRHVADHLAKEGWDVTGFDRAERADAEYRQIRGDLRNAHEVSKAARGMDVVCHIGAIGDVYLAGERPDIAAAVNVEGSANVARAAREHALRVVYASTWEVYGAPRYQPIDEDHPCNPDHPYSITKLAGERLLLAADELDDVPVLSLRLGTAYGTGLRPNSVFRIFVDRARRKDPIVIQGDGSQSRQFTHASDIARAFAMASRAQIRGMALNIVSPESTTIKELMETVVDNYPTDVTFEPARPGDVAPALVSSEAARDVLGWEAEIGFGEGMADLMAATEEAEDGA